MKKQKFKSQVLLAKDPVISQVMMVKHFTLIKQFYYLANIYNSLLAMVVYFGGLY